MPPKIDWYNVIVDYHVLHFLVNSFFMTMSINPSVLVMPQYSVKIHPSSWPAACPKKAMTKDWYHASLS